MMEVRKPYLKWHMGAYKLEGSAAHHKVAADTHVQLFQPPAPNPPSVEIKIPHKINLLRTQRAVSTPSVPSPLRASVTPTPDTPTPAPALPVRVPQGSAPRQDAFQNA